MNKITIDVTKIKKEKLRNGKYLDLVQIDFKDGPRDKKKQDGTLIESATSKLSVLGIVKQDGTKDEELPIIGETTTWVEKDDTDSHFTPNSDKPQDDIDVDDIPWA